MSDESDEKRRPSADGSAPEKDDATKLDLPAVEDDATQVAPAKATAAVPPPSDEDTLTGGSRPDDTLDDVRTVPAYTDKPTTVLPADDWAPSRANPAWSGRAEVRTPQPGRGYPEVDWSAAAEPAPGGRDRWWMPIVVGLIALVLLGVLAWAIYLIVQNSDNDEAPAPAVTASSAAAPTRSATATTQATTPSSAPATTTTAPSPTTTEPTITEVPVPALRGLTLEAAQAALNATGLNYRIKYRAVDAPAGTVVDSDPAEGQEVPPDTVVTLVVAGDGATTVPTSAATTGATEGTGTDGD
ncbi:PASTA domain-containing protein [Actinoplanes sp. NPDC049596]|uniref:PASTA domain-containing protein n=1 Tax=unclassified Actinoplanes TaxID=2626549 RepID=UPI003435326F